MPDIMDCPQCGEKILALEVPGSYSAVLVSLPGADRWCRVNTGEWGLLETYQSHSETCKPKTPKEGKVLLFRGSR